MLKVLQFILDSISALINTIVSLFEFLVNSIKSLLNLFLNFPKYINFIMSSINLLPLVIIPFAIASVSIYVVYTIIGRSHNG